MLLTVPRQIPEAANDCIPPLVIKSSINARVMASSSREKEEGFIIEDTVSLIIRMKDMIDSYANLIFKGAKNMPDKIIK